MCPQIELFNYCCWLVKTLDSNSTISVSALNLKVIERETQTPKLSITKSKTAATMERLSEELLHRTKLRATRHYLNHKTKRHYYNYKKNSRIIAFITNKIRKNDKKTYTKHHWIILELLNIKRIKRKVGRLGVEAITLFMTFI